MGLPLHELAIGLPPKAVARLCRSKRARELAGTMPWAELALECGYHDQSHLIHFARARGAGATVIEELNDLPHGVRRYGCTDPQGHEWFFAQTIGGRGADA